VPGAIDVFLNIQKDMLPTPAKSHYLFNLRDVSRVIQGIQSVHKQKLTSIRKVVRLWIHEMERVFGDRFIDKADSEKFYRQVIKSGKEKVREDILGALEEVSEYGSKVKVMPEVMINKIMFTTLLDD
jgi:dynein heavy chain